MAEPPRKPGTHKVSLSFTFAFEELPPPTPEPPPSGEEGEEEAFPDDPPPPRPTLDGTWFSLTIPKAEKAEGSGDVYAKYRLPHPLTGDGEESKPVETGMSDTMMKWLFLAQQGRLKLSDLPEVVSKRRGSSLPSHSGPLAVDACA